jgi:WD40 repeat protein
MSGASNPYVGPRAFTTGEQLFGRNGERAALLDLVVAERVVLLHAPSGAGKSSLLYAGLVPDLRAEGFRVRPPIRVGTEPPAGATVNRYTLSALLSLEEEASPQRPLGELQGLTLAQYLGPAPDEAEVLIFDQFEEVLTLDPIDRAAKHAFFADLGAALKSSQRWAVIAIREDHLAGLAPYQRALPTRLRTTFHLDLLTAEAALAAVQLPARELGVEFTDAAAAKLIDDLRQVQVQTAEGGTMRVPGPHVEPVQLQVTCRNLWERRPEGAARIDERDVQQIGDVDQALTRYYDDQVATVASVTATPELEIRTWFDRALISDQGLRGQVLQGAERTHGLANAVVRRLVDTHLVRAEQRRGVVWFELAHDRMIGPVRASNSRWSEAHLGPSQRQAQMWDGQGRPESLLLAQQKDIDARLGEADVGALERVYLEQCRSLRAREAVARRLQARVYVLSAVTLVGLLVTLTTLVIIYQLRSTAELERREEAEADRDKAATAAEAARRTGRIALSRQLAATVLLMPEERADLAALYAVTSSRLGQGWEARNGLRNLLGRASQLVGQVRGTMRPLQLAHDPSRGVLAGVDADGRLHLWELRTRRTIAAPRIGIGHSAVIYDPTRQRFVTADRFGSVSYFDPATGDATTQALESYPLATLALSADGARLATAGYRGQVAVWTAATGKKLEQIDLADDPEIDQLALDATGETLAFTVNREPRLWRWDSGEMHRLTVPGGAGEEPPAGLEFAADGALVGLFADGRVLRWDRSTPHAPGAAQELAMLAPETTRVLALGLGAGGARAASVVCLDACTREALVGWEAASGRVEASTVDLPDRRQGGGRFDLLVTPQVAIAGGTRVAARLWDLTSWRPLAGSPREISALAVSQDGSWIAGGGCREAGAVCGEEQVMVWSARDRGALHGPLRGLGGRPVGLAFFADDTRLAGVGQDGTVVIWDMSSGTALPSRGLPSEPRPLALGRRDGGLLAAIGLGDEVQLWDVVAAEFVPVKLRGPGGPIQSLAIDPTATRVVAGGCMREEEGDADLFARERGGPPAVCKRGSLYLWELASGKLLGAPVEAHDEAVVALAFAPDGLKLISVGADGSVLRWATAGGMHEDRGLEDATNPAEAGVFSPNSEAIYTIGCPREGCLAAEVELRLWSGEPLVAIGASMRGHSPLPREGVVLRRQVAFAAGGDALVTSGADGVCLMDIRLESMRRRACGIAGRDLSAADWRRYLEDGESQPPACPEVPRPDLPDEL